MLQNKIFKQGKTYVTKMLIINYMYSKI